VKMTIGLSWHACALLPLLLLWQGSSCHSTNSNSVNTNERNANRNAVSAPISGSWGGPDIALEVMTEGIELNFDCGHGYIDKGIAPDSDGKFSVNGTYVREHGGAMRSDENPDSRAAGYKGQVTGEKMTLTVTFPDGTQDIGPFNLERGKPGRIHKCM
jgi:hypothetical protein